MLLVPTYLDMSKVHGIGVFAAEEIPARTVVWTYTPGIDVALTAEQVKAQPPHIFAFLKRYAFTMKLMPDMYILCPDNGRFVNHSEAQNLDDDGQDQDVARHHIKKGEELTANYHENFGPEPVFDWKPGEPWRG